MISRHQTNSRWYSFGAVAGEDAGPMISRHVAIYNAKRKDLTPVKMPAR